MAEQAKAIISTYQVEIMKIAPVGPASSVAAARLRA
jgi:hypothetical protein